MKSILPEIKSKLPNLIVFGLSLACLTACVSLTPTSPANETGESFATPTKPTRTPTPIPATLTPTLFPTSTPSSATPQSPPDILDASIAGRLLFSNTEDCSLPCWYGLHLGKASIDEVELKIRQKLSLPPDYAFPIRSTLEGESVAYYAQGYWTQQAETPNALNPIVIVRSFFDPETQLVTSLFFGWDNITGVLTSPHRIMQMLGEPTGVWIDLQMTEYAEVAILRANFYFAERDFSVTMISRIPVLINQPQNPNVRKAQWCLNGGKGYEELSFYAVIYPPLNSALPVLNQAREFDLQSIQMSINKGQLAPLEDVFNVTPKEMYQQVIQDENACLEFEF